MRPPELRAADERGAQIPLEYVDTGAGLATWGAGTRPDGRPGIYALAGDGGRLRAWIDIEPVPTVDEARALAGALNRRVAAAVGVRS